MVSGLKASRLNAAFSDHLQVLSVFVWDTTNQHVFSKHVLELDTSHKPSTTRSIFQNVAECKCIAFVFQPTVIQWTCQAEDIVRMETVALPAQVYIGSKCCQ